MVKHDNACWRMLTPLAAALDNACFIVKGATGPSAPGRREAAKLLIRDEARRIAANITELPVLLRKPHL